MRSSSIPSPAAIARASLSAAYPPPIRNVSSAREYRSTLRSSGRSSIVEPELLDPFQLLVDAAARQHVGHGRTAVEHPCDAGILWQVPEPTLADHPPGGRFDGATEHPEQARLAGAVASDDADLVAGHDGEAGRLDDESAADLHRELLRL